MLKLNNHQSFFPLKYWTFRIWPLQVNLIVVECLASSLEAVIFHFNQPTGGGSQYLTLCIQPSSWALEPTISSRLIRLILYYTSSYIKSILSQLNYINRFQIAHKMVIIFPSGYKIFYILIIMSRNMFHPIRNLKVHIVRSMTIAINSRPNIIAKSSFIKYN